MRNKIKKWTKEENDWLIKNFSLKSNGDCATFLKVSKDQIVYQAQKLNLNKVKNWSEEDDYFLINNYNSKNVDFCAKHLNKTRDLIKSRASFLNLCKKKKKWTNEEEKFLINNYEQRGAIFCSTYLNTPIKYVYAKAKYLNLKINERDCKEEFLENYYNNWTQEENDFLIKNYSTLTVEECCFVLKRSYNSVSNQAKKLNITEKTIPWEKDEEEFLKIYYPSLGSEFCEKLLNKGKGKIASKKMSLKIGKEKCVPDYESFIRLDCPETIYLMGYIWGDGFCSPIKQHVELSIAKEDMDEIKWMFNKFGTWNEIYQDRDMSRKPVHRIYTSNKQIYDLFCNLDYINKSRVEPVKVLNEIPDSLKHYFFRGFFDADGCWTISKNNKMFSLTGPKDSTWEETIKILKFIGIEKIPTRIDTGKLGGKSTLYLCNYKSIELLGDYVYQNYLTDKIGLSRKFCKFMEIKRNRIKNERIRNKNEEPLQLYLVQ